MDFIGKWRIDEALSFTTSDDGVKQEWRKVADILADESVEEGDKKMLRAEVSFKEDGRVQWCLPVPDDFPKEELDELVASGEFTLAEDGKIVIEEKQWKLEDGKLMYDTGIKGEVFGEEVSSWTELKEENGLMEIMVYRLARV